VRTVTVYFADRLKDGRWRIVCSENGFTRDLCGAINEHVARQQAEILTAMRRVST